MANPAFGVNAFAKPEKGSAWLAAKQRSAQRKAAEEATMREAKQRDGHQCRVPQCQYAPKKPRLEVAHLEHRGMGGNPTGDRTTLAGLVTLCFLHHAQLDLALLEIQPMTRDGANGPCAFYVRNRETGEFKHVATEVRR